MCICPASETNSFFSVPLWVCRKSRKEAKKTVWFFMCPKVYNTVMSIASYAFLLDVAPIDISTTTKQYPKKPFARGIPLRWCMRQTIFIKNAISMYWSEGIWPFYYWSNGRGLFFAFVSCNKIHAMCPTLLKHPFSPAAVGISIFFPPHQQSLMQRSLYSLVD